MRIVNCGLKQCRDSVTTLQDRRVMKLRSSHSLRTLPALNIAYLVHRRGFSMVIVMLAIGMSLALTYGFVQTQVTSLRLTQNDSRRDLALEAARTGVSIGLKRMQDPAWVGVADVYSQVIQQDTTNKIVCDVSCGAVASGQVAGVPDVELPLHVCITSKGTWSSPSNSAEKVSRTVTAFVKLLPRLPGRTARAGDLATASDQSVNPSNYEATLLYTLTAKGSGTSLDFDPATRIEGPIWLRDKIDIYNSSNWSSSVRSSMLTEVGNQYGSTVAANFQHPHPMNGPLLFSSSPKSSIQTDLSRLKTIWTTTTTTPDYSALDLNLWSNYRLFDRGFIYQAATLSGTLENATLRPSATNPLGIFVQSGNLTVRGQVVVQGTLVVNGKISFQGAGVSITAYNWLGATGSPLITDADKWPRLPAIVAQNVDFTNTCRVVIEGAVLLNSQLTGTGVDFGYSSGTQVDITGTATAVLGQQPYSTIQLVNSPDLTALTSDQNYAIWLTKGTSGRWYQIQSVDRTARTLTVVGEIQNTTAVSYRIRLNRSQFVDLNGPLAVDTINVSICPSWFLWSFFWDDRYTNWTNTNVLRLALGQVRLSFPDWLANPANFSNWGLQYTTYGLPLEPTFHLRPTSGVKYLSTGPIFRPFVGTTTTDSAFSGYRWKIIDWREET